MLSELLANAIVKRQSVSAQFEGKPLEFSPHLVGADRSSAEVVVGYAYSGETGASHEWRVMHLDKLSAVKTNDDPWLVGEGEAPRDGLVVLYAARF